jgi:steroid delta-isomerase-like uncharacterized protein
MSVGVNETLVRRLFDDVLNTGNVELVDDILAPGYLNHFGGMPPADRDTFKRLLPLYPASFANFHMDIEDLIAEGDRVTVRFTMHGTHEAEFMGVPPTHRQISMGGMAFFRIADGKIVEEYINEDLLGMMQQLTTPPTGPAPTAE